MLSAQKSMTYVAEGGKENRITRETFKIALLIGKRAKATLLMKSL
jgi:hypothetical protein